MGLEFRVQIFEKRGEAWCVCVASDKAFFVCFLGCEDREGSSVPLRSCPLLTKVCFPMCRSEPET